MASDGEIQELIRQLSSDDSNVRNSAAWEIGLMTNNGKDITSTIPILNNELRKEDTERRLIAVTLLHEMTGKGMDISEAIPILIKCLGDNDANVRTYALNTLKKAIVNGLDVEFGKVIKVLETFAKKQKLKERKKRK